MDGFEVMPALEAAERGDLFVTVTGSRGVAARASTSSGCSDGAVLANAGHFDVEIDLRRCASWRRARARCARWSRSTTLGDGRRLNLLAEGRVVNLAAAEGHPAAVMDMSFANQALAVEHLVASGRHARARRPRRADGDRRGDRAPEARVARRGDRRAHADAAGLSDVPGPAWDADSGAA